MFEKLILEFSLFENDIIYQYLDCNILWIYYYNGVGECFYMFL